MQSGNARKILGVGVRTKFSIVWCRLSGMRNTGACSVHMHNNGTHGVRSIDRVQRNFVGAHAMWVYVVARQFS
jgi:hypothetical protein